VFVNVAGGVRIDEPGADLAVCLAIASAARGAAARPGLAAFGEVGLTGRLRPATQAERRLEECAKLGLEAVLAPPGTPKKSKLKIVEADTIGRAISVGLSAKATDA
jgi:DNA repair protein RadA/Sms